MSGFHADRCGCEESQGYASALGDAATWLVEQGADGTFLGPLTGDAEALALLAKIRGVLAPNGGGVG